MSLVDKILPRVDRAQGAPTTASPAPPSAGSGNATSDVGEAIATGEVRCCETCGAEAASDQLVCLECGTRLDQPRPRWQQPAIAAAVAVLLVGALALGLNEVSKDPEAATAKTVKKYVAGPPPVQQVPDVSTTETPKPPKTPKTPTTSPNPTDTASADTGDSTSSYPSSGSTGSSGSFYSGGGYTGGSTGGGSTDGTETTTTPSGPPPVDEWRSSDKAAWTVVMLSTTSKDEAERYARKLTKAGIEPAGILRSNDFKNLANGIWIVWAGRFGGKVSGEDKAYEAADDYSDEGFDGESVEYIRPRAPSEETDEGSEEDESDDADQGSDEPADDSRADTTTP